jgi:hypothetical protein
MKTLLRADSVNVQALPPGLPAYAGYVDGQYENWSALVARFGARAHLTSITVEGGEAQICDCENGDLTPAQAVKWLGDYVTSHVAHRQRRGIYFELSLLPTIQGLIATSYPVLRRLDYLLWGADLGSARPSSIPDGLDAIQYSGGPRAPYDLSLVSPAWFTRWP